MSEREPQYEHGNRFEIDPKQVEKLKEQQHERLKQAAEHAEADRPSYEKLREAVEKAAKDKDHVLARHKHEKASEAATAHASTHVKAHAGRQTVKRVQKQLKPHDRAFSKVVHQPVVDAVSNAAEGTVARPSGLLFGGLFSVIGSLVVLYICRHYGYEYNFTIGLLCLIGGFFLGLIFEAGYRLVKRS